MVQVLGKTAWQFLKKLNIELPYDSEFPLVGVRSEKMKTYVHTKTRAGMFMAALFIIAKKKQSDVHPEECIHKLWYIHTLECYLARSE